MLAEVVILIDVLIFLYFNYFQSEIKLESGFKPIIAETQIDNINIKILPRLELVSGVLSQTDWKNEILSINKETPYYSELKW